MVTLPLANRRVLDFGDEASALASRLLADLGAEVIRIESISGDSIRTRPPFANGAGAPEGALAHLLYNAGKQSVALALQDPRAWRVADRVLQQVDVVVAPLAKDPLARSFFDEAHLMTVAPRVSVIDLVFRRAAPAEHATDLIATAAGGLLYLNGYAEDPPNLPAGALAFKQASLAGALAAASLMLEAAIRGNRGRATISVQEAVMWTTIQSANQNYWYWHHAIPGRHGLAGLSAQTIFQAADGRWVSFYQHPPAWGAFVKWVEEALGEAPFASPEWDSQHFRYEHQDEVTAVTERLCKSSSRDELVSEAQRRQILVVPVQSVSDISHDPHLRDRQFFETIGSDARGRNVESYRPPFISSAYQAHARPAPRLGDASRAVLRDIAGFGEAEIAGLVESGIVGIGGRP